MNNLFDATDTAAILARLDCLAPAAQKQWGKMNAAQMLAHCTASLETAMDLNQPKKLPLIIRLIGAMMKSTMFGEKPFARNGSTDKLYIIHGDRDFDTEKTKVMARIKAFAAGGPEASSRKTHVFFGKLRPEEWAIMQWKHFDHHLRQFGA